MNYNNNQKKTLYSGRSFRVSLSVVFLAGLLSFSSCGWFQGSAGKDPVARVNNQYLYRNDLLHVVPSNTSAADSTLLIQRYIEKWIHQQVLLQEASRSLSADEKKSFEKQLQDYHHSLMIFAWENQQVDEHLDTLVGDQELLEYYEKDKESFQLRQNIARVRYVKIPRTIDTNNVTRLMSSEDEESQEELEDYCLEHAASYLLDDEVWLIFKDLQREIPIETDDPESFLRNNRIVELSDDYYRYYLHIMDYKLKGGIPPLAFERDNIRNIIINERKLRFMNQLRNQLYQEALSESDVETYY
ncbi:MAG: hypothetical protein R6U64_04605 [Bacteroidales bacterium]